MRESESEAGMRWARESLYIGLWAAWCGQPRRPGVRSRDSRGRLYQKSMKEPPSEGNTCPPKHQAPGGEDEEMRGGGDGREGGRGGR